ncbi:MAG TPA: prepilin-type N-terminal cleavage/methylation domain-containing protein [Thermoanaerobaculia bacterium]|nr:prepilin-type N-terminal cleavage/methylation domain-containing protein [Thermoanaerobaculia bacterium]
MEMRVPSSGLRRTTGPSARAGERGFSLVELLVVIAILAVLFIAGGRSILKAWQRQKLASAATDVKVLFQRALPEMQRLGITTFVQVGPLVTTAAVRYIPIYLIGDANGDGQVTAGFANPAPVGGDLLIDEYDIIVLGKTGVKGVTGESEDFCLSVNDITEVQSSRWLNSAVVCAVPTDSPFCDAKPWTVGRALQCDFQGRAIDTNTGLQLAGPAQLVLTHVGVVNGAFTPPTRYVLSINPVWSVRIQKQIRDVSSNWVDQLGG